MCTDSSLQYILCFQEVPVFVARIHADSVFSVLSVQQFQSSKLISDVLSDLVLVTTPRWLMDVQTVSTCFMRYNDIQYTFL